MFTIRPQLTLPHAGYHRATEASHGGQLGCRHFLPVGIRCLENVPGLSTARIVDHDVHAAELCPRGVHNPVRFQRVRYVGRHCKNLGFTLPHDLLRCLVQAVGCACHKNDACAVFGQLTRNSKANSGTRSCDDGCFSGNAQFHQRFAPSSGAIECSQPKIRKCGPPPRATCLPDQPTPAPPPGNPDRCAASYCGAEVGEHARGVQKMLCASRGAGVLRGG